MPPCQLGREPRRPHETRRSCTSTCNAGPPQNRTLREFSNSWGRLCASARTIDDSVIIRTSTCERVVERHPDPHAEDGRWLDHLTDQAHPP